MLFQFRPPKFSSGKFKRVNEPPPLRPKHHSVSGSSKSFGANPELVERQSRRTKRFVIKLPGSTKEPALPPICRFRNKAVVKR